MKKNIKKINLSQPKKSKNKSKGMEPIIDNVAGIDIGSSLIHVAILNENSEYEVREFATFTPDLIEIANWLIQSNVKTSAMEATGVYWIPLFEILEDSGLKPALVDPKSAKNVPGRKTDVLDCQWIHRLYSCGLLRPAFRPAKSKEAFRAFMRHRGNLIKARQKAILQMDKSLLLMNIKLDIAGSEVASISGMNIIRAIVKGERGSKKISCFAPFFLQKTRERILGSANRKFPKNPSIYS